MADTFDSSLWEIQWIHTLFSSILRYYVSCIFGPSNQDTPQARPLDQFVNARVAWSKLLSFFHMFDNYKSKVQESVLQGQWGAPGGEFLESLCENVCVLSCIEA